jgi:hypothetical protein
VEDHRELSAKLFQELDRLQFGPCERQVVFRPVPCGLGGQISGRVQTLLLGLALNRRAHFSRLDDPPYGQTFVQLEGPGEPREYPDAIPVATPGAPQDDPLVCYDPLQMTDRGEELDRALMDHIAARLGVRVPSKFIVEGIIFKWLKPTAEMSAFCDRQRKRLGVDLDTLGVHFRRGDKSVETPFVPVAEINRRIAELHELWAYKKLFLASDSPLAPLEIACPPGVTLIFDDQEQRYNNANHKMLLSSPELGAQETQVAFKNISLLAHCGGLIGQHNAHFATLAGSAIAARDGSAERVVIIDGALAEKRSPMLRAYFGTKRTIRALGRRLLPGLAMRARLAAKVS